MCPITANVIIMSERMLSETDLDKQGGGGRGRGRGGGIVFIGSLSCVTYWL